MHRRRWRRCAPANQSVHAGQAFVVDIPEPIDADAQPEALPLPHPLPGRGPRRVDKPAGMVVHPAAGHSTGTLVNALLHHVNDLSGIGGEKRPGIVHRLDRGTSGLMVVAKNDAAHQELSRQFQRSRGREGIHRAGLGRGAGRPAHRRADRPRSVAAAEDVDARHGAPGAP